MEKYYKVLLVDDEAEIREGMAQRIPWETLGFQICGTAENGVEALDLIEKEYPEIIITDIQMPFMDGLELIDRAQSLLPLSKFIVFSGYDLFEYAQKAISLDVAEYLLKPFSAQDLMAVLQKVKTSMDEEKQAQRNIESLQAQFEASLPLLRQSFLLSCLSNGMSAERLQQQSESLSLSSYQGYGVVLFDIGSLKEMPHFQGKAELYFLAMKQFVSEHLAPLVTSETFIFGEVLVSILLFETKLDMNELLTRINEICREASRINGGTVVAGVSQPVGHLKQLARAYRQAQEALADSYRLDRQELFTIYIRDVVQQSTDLLILTEQEQRNFANLLKLGSSQGLESFVAQMFEKISANHLSLAQYRVYLLEHVTLLLRMANSYEHAPLLVFEEDVMEKIGQIEKLSLEEMRMWFLQKALQLSRTIQMTTADSGKAFIQKAKLLVKERYHQPDLSIEQISQELYLSAAYFSSMFKKETGQSFVSYLTKERLKQALVLLETTADKSYMIAEKVGYSEPNYFSYVFKKHYGLSPSKYRKQLAQAAEKSL
ncbi:response regulator [Enterococcus sp. LJL98]